MCGFVGVISKTAKKFPEETLRKMNAMIVHRGPDDEGFFSDGEWISLAFRRLSILDLSEKGHQPMVDRENGLAIVFNGEIYNFKELRSELQASGCSFNSDSDTEVLLAAYRVWGKKCLDRFIGMFAFVIADLRKKEVFFARDQLGIKPLFHFEDADYHIFCSEIKSILPYKNLEPDPTAFDEYIIFRSVIGSNTMFKGVSSVLQGHCGELKTGRVRISKYFDINSTIRHNKSKSFEDSCEETEHLFRESVKIHLRSDVELGVQLSGGVDSSLITALASEMTGKKLHSFSISFKEDVYDESEYQKRISKRYNTEHHDYAMSSDIFMDFLMPSIWHYEHPLNDPNTVCTYYLTEQARKHITVMLAGEGADESFMGYGRFSHEFLANIRKRNFLYYHPGIRNLISRLWPLKKGESFLNISRYSPSMYALSYADLNFTDLLLKGDDSGIKFRKEVLKMGDRDSLMETILQYELCDLPQWFWRADRMGMASSMELRVPFCTVPMFSLANTIPYSKHLRGGVCKSVLKKVAEKYIDNDQIYRKKVGFGTPFKEWILKAGGRGSDLFEEVINSESIRKRDGINSEHLDNILKLMKEGKFQETNAGFLWTYFCFELWYRIFFDGGWKKFAPAEAL
ncbi:MAG: asparagine synthase (glutamine-hydrolyzing) [Lentisphaerae bacterium GWF2_45_14]|nr:MAG: asparagine synthase (glutamine-hydrolyzing) [Lentisphaerae bacterium GWF2_45_14]